MPTGRPCAKYMHQKRQAPLCRCHGVHSKNQGGSHAQESGAGPQEFRGRGLVAHGSGAHARLVRPPAGVSEISHVRWNHAGSASMPAPHLPARDPVREHHHVLARRRGGGQNTHLPGTCPPCSPLPPHSTQSKVGAGTNIANERDLRVAVASSAAAAAARRNCDGDEWGAMTAGLGDVSVVHPTLALLFVE